MSGTETSADSISDDLSSAFGTETSAEAPASTADATAQPPAASGEAPASLSAPNHWSEGDRTLFATAPREVQQRWIDREKEQQKGLDAKFQEVAGFRREREQLEEMFAPYAREMELRGQSRPQFMSQLMGVYRFLRESPAEALRWLAQENGVDLSSLTEQAAQPNPQVDQLNKQFRGLAQRVDGFVSAQQQAEHRANLGRVDSFATAKDEKGQPLHPYFDEVQEDILAILKSQPPDRKDLDAAYKKAIRMNDEVWTKVQAAEATAKQARADATRKAEIDKAKRAGTTSAAREATNGTTRPSTLKDDLEAGFANWQP